MTTAATLAATPLVVIALWAYALFVFFLAYIPIKAAFDRGTLKRERTLGCGAAYLTLGIGGVLDVGFNVLAGSLIFRELPRREFLTFTKRCRKWQADPGYRGRFARAVCRELNVFEEHHC